MRPESGVVPEAVALVIGGPRHLGDRDLPAAGHPRLALGEHDAGAVGLEQRRRRSRGACAASFSAASLQAPPQITIERLAKVPQP